MSNILNLGNMADFFTSRHLTMEDALQSDKQLRFVMGNDGVYKVVKNPIGVFCVKTNKVPGAEEIKEGFQFTLPKVPYIMFLKTLSFFRDVFKYKSGAEAMVQFYFNPVSDEYLMYCPQQIVSGAAVRYERNQELDSTCTLVMDIHSHNSMSAFFSSIDNADEKENRLFGVVGKVHQDTPEWKFRAGVGGEFKDLTLFDIFENPFAQVEYPTEWLERCQKHAVGSHTNFDRRDAWEGGAVRRSVAPVPTSGPSRRYSRDVFKDDYYEDVDYATRYAYTDPDGYANIMPVEDMTETEIIDLVFDLAKNDLLDVTAEAIESTRRAMRYNAKGGKK